MADDKLTGISTNPGLGLDAQMFAEEGGFVENNPNGIDSKVVSTNQDYTILFDSGIIPSGTLHGLVGLKIIWGSEFNINVGSADLNKSVLHIDILESGESIFEEPVWIKVGTWSYITGARIINFFRESDEYQIIISTGAIESKKVWIDTVRFELIPSGTYVTSLNWGYNGIETTESVPVVQSGVESVTGDGTTQKQITVTLPTTINQTAGDDVVIASTQHPNYLVGADLTSNGKSITITVKRLDGATWSTTATVNWIVMSRLTPPIIDKGASL